jgi:hypothetical protein
MKRFLLIAMIAGLAACNDTTKVENEVNILNTKIDTLAKRVEESVVVDSIKLKGGRLLDSTKSKGGRLVKGLENKLKDLENKRDSIK